MHEQLKFNYVVWIVYLLTKGTTEYDFYCLRVQDYHNTSAGMLTWLLITTNDSVIALPGVGIFGGLDLARWRVRLLWNEYSLGFDVLRCGQSISLIFEIV